VIAASLRKDKDLSEDPVSCQDSNTNSRLHRHGLSHYNVGTASSCSSRRIPAAALRASPPLSTPPKTMLFFLYAVDVLMPFLFGGALVWPPSFGNAITAI